MKEINNWSKYPSFFGDIELLFWGPSFLEKRSENTNVIIQTQWNNRKFTQRENIIQNFLLTNIGIEMNSIFFPKRNSGKNVTSLVSFFPPFFPLEFMF